MSGGKAWTSTIYPWNPKSVQAQNEPTINPKSLSKEGLSISAI